MMLNFCQMITVIYIGLLLLLFIKTTDAIENNDIVIQAGSTTSSITTTAAVSTSSSITTTSASSPSSSFSISLFAPSLQICRVIGLKIYLQSGYEDDEYLISGRNGIENLENNNYICSETTVGDNIEAILNPECNTTLLKQQGGVQILLRNLTANRRNGDNLWSQNTTQYDTPYFLYGRNNTQILGKPIPIGPYQLLAYPNNNRGKGHVRYQFNMIPCAYYLPKNECSKCQYMEQTCEGSQCITTSHDGIRITLLIFGQDTYDFGINITSPLRSTINAYYKTDRKNYNTTDIVTGGYVEKDYKEESCRSTGVWIKNIVYPKYIPGKYSITLENVLKCNFLGPPFFGTAPSNQNRFILNVYRNETLIQSISSTNNVLTGQKYDFTL